MKRLLLLSGVMLFVAAPIVSGTDTPDTTDLLKCIEPIKSTCVGLEDNLETCLAERAAQLPVACRQVLQSAIDKSQSSEGSGACIADVKLLCAGLDVNALAQCIIAKKADFSQACRDYLDSAPAPAAPDPQP